MRQFPTLDGIKDTRTREVLSELYYALDNSILSIGFKKAFANIKPSDVGAKIAVAHSLGYKPSNIIMTFIAWEKEYGTVSILYNDTDKDKFYVQATEPCVITFLVGGRDGK